MKNLDAWKYALTPSPYPAENPAEASLSFHDTKWKVVLVGITKQDFIRENEGWWFRKKITLTDAMIKENPGILFKAVDDNALVYVNGRLAGKHDGYDRHFEFSIGGLAKPGENVIAVYVQNIGGPGGIYRPVVLRWGRAQAVDADLKFHHSLNGEIAQWQDKYFDDSTWSAISSWEDAPSTQSITWYRGEFSLPEHKDWVIPWRLHIESSGNIQIWLNGRLLGRYFAAGPQTDFDLPDGWLNTGEMNRVAFVLRPSGSGTALPRMNSAYVAPYEDYVVQKHTLEVKFK